MLVFYHCLTFSNVLMQLKCLTFAIYENADAPENVTETYNFHVEYTDAQISLVLDTYVIDSI